MLCKENLGYKGGGKIPPRETLRFVTLDLDGEKWYLQYSPYGYFARHVIVFSETHANMVIDRRAISHLLSFVDLFPHMFLGSNADLPIVGGSILNHEHFQGGLPVLPLFKAKKSKEFAISAPNVKLYELDFYNTALLLESKSKKDLLDAVEKLRLAWNDYDDPERDILSHSNEQRHSTITPIARKMGDTYQLYVLLRNNRTSNAYPEGIFHAHPEYFHIKQEGIGLIEAAGLFVLPARLVRQSKTLQEAVASGKSNFEIAEEYPELASFFPFADALREGKSKEDYLASVCREILKNTAVFKKDEQGQEGLKQFLERSGL